MSRQRGIQFNVFREIQGYACMCWCGPTNRLLWHRMGNNRKTVSYEYSMMWRPEHLSGVIYRRITETKHWFLLLDNSIVQETNENRTLSVGTLHSASMSVCRPVTWDMWSCMNTNDAVQFFDLKRHCFVIKMEPVPSGTWKNLSRDLTPLWEQYGPCHQPGLHASTFSLPMHLPLFHAYCALYGPKG